MMIDASALVAIILRERGWEAVAVRIEAADGPFTSTVSIIESDFIESALALARDGVFPPSTALAEIELVLERASIGVVSVDRPMIPLSSRRPGKIWSANPQFWGLHFLRRRQTLLGAAALRRRRLLQDRRERKRRPLLMASERLAPLHLNIGRFSNNQIRRR